MSEEHNRRSTDSIILDMHGMLCTLTARLQDHMSWEEKEHSDFKAKLKDLEERVEPLEDARTSLKRVFWAFASLGAAILFGAGTTFWYWIKSKIAPHLPVQ